MLRTRVAQVLSTWLCISMWVVGCGAPPAATPQAKQTEPPAPATTPPAAAAAPQSLTLPTLRTGQLPPRVDETPIAGRLTGYVRTATTETFAIELPLTSLAVGTSSWVVFDQATWPSAYSFVARDPRLVAEEALTREGAIAPRAPARTPDTRTLWLRRPLSTSQKDADKTLSALVYTEPAEGARPAQAHRVSVDASTLPASDKRLTDAYLRALADHLADTELGWLLAKYAAPGALSQSPIVGADWSTLMQVSSGYSSVDAALRAREHLKLTKIGARPKVPLTELRAPELPPHSWAQMLAALQTAAQKTTGKATPAPSEALAAFVPADFYFVRASSFEALQSLLDEAQGWLSATIQLTEDEGRSSALVQRYRKQLGLSQSELTRVLGPELVRDVALVGSDPFVRQGSDVSLLIRAKDSVALKNTLLTKLSIDHPRGYEQKGSQHRGVEISERTTADGELRQYFAELPATSGKDALSIVSNSKLAVQRILDVALGQAPALSDELDFRYMLERDARVAAQVLAYFGERFVLGAISPRQRVLDARRALARAELIGVGQAALLFGWLEGREPKDTRELAQSRWLSPSLLRHSSSEPIRFEVGAAPRSSWGTPEFLTPLLELPEPTHVSEEERAAYQRFAEHYAWQWSERVDPIAARFDFVADGNKRKLEGHVRVLPVVNSAHYVDLWRTAGSGQVSTRALLSGLQLTLGIGQDADLRRELTGRGRSFLGAKFALDWLGEWAAVGVLDDPELARLLQAVGEAPELQTPEEPEFTELLAKVPAYLAVDIKNAAAAALLLTGIKRLAEGSVPDLLTWQEHAKHGAVTIVRVHVEGVSIFYALTKRRLYVALQQPVLEKLLDHDQGNEVWVKSASGVGSQLSLDVAPRDPSGLMLALLWSLENSLRARVYRDADRAEVLLRGAPGRNEGEQKRLGLSYLGSVPETPEGGAFQLLATGVTDPARGSRWLPVYPELPVRGSLTGELFEAFSNLHLETAFDTEPGPEEQRSLRVRFTLEREQGATP